MNNLVDQLAAIVGEKAVLAGDVLRERSVSYWNASPTQALALVKPASTEEVSQILAHCHGLNQSVVVQGGLTGVVAGAESTKDDVIISLERMSQIENVDEEESVATVQAGVVLQKLQETLAEKLLLFPLDLGARGSCTIGGNIATNAGGINVLRYGMVRNLVLGLEVVLMDGTVMSSMYPMLKNNTGYDLKQLFIGSEGTLGVITKIMVRLYPKPTSRQTAMIAVSSFENVMSLLNQFREGLAGTLSAFEVMWQNYYRGVTGENDHRPPMSRDYPFYILIEAEGFDAETDQLRFNRMLETAYEKGQILDAIVPNSDRERSELWIVREEFDPLLPAYLYDVSLPLKHMVDYTEEIDQRLKIEVPGVESVVFGHIADGNLHIFVLPSSGEAYLEAEEHEQANRIIYSCLQSFGGSVSAEHGIGLEKMAWLNINRSEAEMNLMRAIKSAVDPKQLLNPGKVFLV
ncbi:MAG: FAD/FMN-containing dehydrogenase [Candidatus Azotimanducaceae bacterium]